MRIPRLLTILGPASVLYVLAARASSSTATSLEWLVAAFSLGFALTPLAVVRARGGRRLSVLAVMGVSLAVALASSQAASPFLRGAHDIAWVVAVLGALELAVPRNTRTAARYGLLGGYALAAAATASLVGRELLPDHSVALLVVTGIFAVGGLHQIVLVGRGHTVEGALSGLAIVGLAVALAYAWFGPFDGPRATTSELAVASLFWSGHLAWVDPRWRTLRRVGVPVVVACATCFALVYALVPRSRFERWELGMIALGSGVLWWVAFSVARKASERAVWTTSRQLADAATVARGALVDCTTVEDIAAAVLVRFAPLPRSREGLPELAAFEPPIRMRLGSGDRLSVRSGDVPPPITDAVLEGDTRRILDLVMLRPRVVREPPIRALVEVMQERGIGLLVPCVRHEHLEGLLLLPLGDRVEPLSRLELQELGRLGDALGGALSSALAQRRAESHIHELAELHRDAEERIDVLRGEVEQLRGQCDVLGRSLAEDQTLHVAYSPSMRRVQTRAIELAPTEEPILLIAGAGSPVLPVSRFIHDRGPRWDAPFVVADCSASEPEDLLGLLFGSDSGRPGWFDSAMGGSLLLRDLPALPKGAQLRLARALRESSSDSSEKRIEHAALPPRIIATSRIGLEQLRRQGALESALEECFPRVGLVIPPLRERREDVPSLVLLAIDRACRVHARDPVGIDQPAMEALVDHDWPGDVAELELAVELATVEALGKTIRASDLPPLAWPTGEGEKGSLEGTYVEVERRLLERALRRSGGNKSQAARRLGLKRTTFLDKLRRHGLDERSSDEVGGSALG